MPKETFLNLPEEKQKVVVDAFIKEFSDHRYDDASISRVVKELGIAKGSIYQYFKDKLELYLYLKQLCELKKLEYIKGVKREDYKDFWAYYRALFEAGVKFDLRSPQESKFLYCISKNEHSPSVSDFHKEWRDQALAMFEVILQKEVDEGHFRTDISAKTLSFFLIATTVHIGDYMQIYHGTDFDQNVADGKNVFAVQKDILLKSVDEFIALTRGAFAKPKED